MLENGLCIRGIVVSFVRAQKSCRTLVDWTVGVLCLNVLQLDMKTSGRRTGSLDLRDQMIGCLVLLADVYCSLLAVGDVVAACRARCWISGIFGHRSQATFSIFNSSNMIQRRSGIGMNSIRKCCLVIDHTGIQFTELNAICNGCN